ncbi:MAG: ACT domain-containing protein [Pseudomonadota bacterium]
MAAAYPSSVSGAIGIVEMSGETDLETLIRSMSARLHDGVYVFATVPDGVSTEGMDARMTFREAEGTTLILRQDVARAHGLRGEFPCRMITLEVHSALDAVGFLARITRALADAGMGVNPVSAFFQYHLFVPADRAEDAMGVLAGLAKGAA